MSTAYCDSEMLPCIECSSPRAGDDANERQSEEVSTGKHKKKAHGPDEQQVDKFPLKALASL